MLAHLPPGLTGLYAMDHFLSPIRIACRSPRLATKASSAESSEPGRINEYESPRGNAIGDVSPGHRSGHSNGMSGEWSYGQIMTSTYFGDHGTAYFGFKARVGFQSQDRPVVEDFDARCDGSDHHGPRVVLDQYCERFCGPRVGRRIAYAVQ